MANRYANLVGSNKIKDEWQKINTGFDKVQQDVDQLQADLAQEIADREAAVEYVDQRVDNIIVGGGPDKDPELVDIRTPDPSYTPLEPISTAGGMTRDMQRQLIQHRVDNARHNTRTSYIASTPGTEYPNGVSYQEAIPANGWPSIGTIVTVKEGNNRCYQLMIEAANVPVPVARYRSYHTTTGWSDWMVMITDARGSVASLYETGIWTPTLAGMVTAGSHTYHVQYGYYTRIGNLVTVQFRIHLTAKDPAMAGSVFIRGLPYAALSTGAYTGGGAINLISNVELSSGYSAIVYSLAGFENQIALNQIGNNVQAVGLPSSAIKDGSIISGTISYHIQG
mgnify:CR=1 FL=1